MKKRRIRTWRRGKLGLGARRGEWSHS